MLLEIIFIVTAVKAFFMPLYRSTDFEVHRNWLAVTHNLTLEQWYHDNTSEWTLDYPPFFAWLEFALSHVAKIFDPEMVKIENLNYASDMTVLFQRLSVIVLDIVYIYGAFRCTKNIANGNLLVFLLLITNPGLIMVDHIHFQYNGFLFGILLLSISNMLSNNYLYSAFWFAVLLNFKHIFLYMAPVYVVHLLRAYCFTVSSTDGVHTPWYSFSVTNLFKLATTVIFVFCLSFGPFIDQLPQVFSRLFPFKRGLCHAYWAPNFWALYNFADKILQHFSTKLGIPVVVQEAAMTGGLVQEYRHAVLPTITPAVTFVLTAAAMAPALVKLWYLGADRRYRGGSFLRCLTLCATCAFMFGWHVHEKAILMILIPLSFLSVLGITDARLYMFMSVVGHYSLFPLLYPKNLLPIKIFILLTHLSIVFSYLPSLYEPKTKTSRRRGFLVLPKLKASDSLYLYGLIGLCIYENVLHTFLGLDKTLPFLPLMMTSVYCALGVFYFWVRQYIYFLTFNLSSVPTLTTSTNTKSVYEKKET
ncbi:probable dolichyl pyrophosphate Glc1Man9GlcNAc2 alpha-1,3-glucosyltransferase [Maniola jurtina]|uniref:probable dolichyl pyrophosphate Glc1Man9GlcNAc2 alpha-1,3-glucosyltransferase n=1 Tax=Maniola jurtina TaxID=191418 RepID=UPI001E687F97|nr:probable dolichyl pyrophosphate Glc1Man9GlcNAc2 alpha-1,3-glucosyltransferase [Maniola jurtina]